MPFEALLDRSTTGRATQAAANAQRSGSLALLVVGLVDALKERRADGTALTGTLDHKQPLVDLAGVEDELGEVVKAASDAEVGWVVDDRLDPERAAVFEVLLDAGMLVAKVDSHFGAAGHDPRAEPVAGASGLASEHE